MNPVLCDTMSELTARVRLATATATPPRLLEALAMDPDVTVRAAVAMNAAATAAAELRLVGDQDERVRALLGSRLAALCPELSADDLDETRAHVLSLLRRLASDAAERVRVAIADVLKDMPQAPRELILTLAKDPVTAVSDPVIRLSPVLTEDDLIALLTTRPAAATAVAMRIALPSRASDWLATAADDDTVAVLLENRGAAIQEATLDDIVDRAEPRPRWHAPLVNRPSLTAYAARTLSGFVANDLLATLAARGDLAGPLIAELQQRLQTRLAQPAGPGAPARSQPAAAGRGQPDGLVWPEEDPPAAAALLLAHRLFDAKGLDDEALLKALRRGQARFATAMLAVAGSVPASHVARAITLRSAKALTSLVWKAGLSPAMCVPVQIGLGHLKPDDTLPDDEGGFALTEDEMRWQVAFLGRPAS